MCSTIIAILLTVHILLLGWCSYRYSPVSNEPAHVVAGLSHWKFGRFEVYRVNPPLVRMIAAVPLFVADPKTDWTSFFEAPGARPEFTMGLDFVAANGERTCWFITLARWACIPFSVIGAVYTLLWARDLFGRRAGLLALTLWCFCPNLLAHGSLITADRGAAALGIAAGYYFWKWLRTPSWRLTILAGAALGLAQLTKFTWIPLFVLWPIAGFIWNLSLSPHHSRRFCASWTLQLVTICGIGLYVIHVGYGFEHSFERLRDFEFVSDTLKGHESASEDFGNRFEDTWLKDVPVPFPRNYVLGIDVQKKDFEDFGRPSYLAGQWSNRGWWYYYLYAAAIKIQIGVLILAAMAIFQTIDSDKRWRDTLFLAVQPLTVLVLASAQLEINHHFRYVLPSLPFLFIWASQIVAESPMTTRRKTMVAIAVGWSVGSSLWIYPHSLSYFNEFVGGPLRGHRHLLHSNIDWGQDLNYLREWLNENPQVDSLYLADSVSYDPQAIGIRCVKFPGRSSDGNELDEQLVGWYAIGVDFLHGYRYRAPYRADTRFQRFQPVAIAGYSIYIYDLTKRNAVSD